MTNYETIQTAILTEVPSWAIQGRYVTDLATDPVRTFLAYVLGKSHSKGGGQQHCVLAYQYDGPNTASDDAKKWRCFKVDSFPLDSLVAVHFVPPPTLTIPDPLT